MKSEGISPPEITQDQRFQMREWTIQRIGWAIMVLFTLGALSGLFGRGRLSSATLSSRSGDLVVKYERIARHNSRTRLVVQLPGSSGEVGIWLDRELLQDLELQQIIPPPVRSASTGDRNVFYFQVTPRATVVFLVDPQRIGLRRSRLGLASDSSGLPLRYLILP